MENLTRASHELFTRSPDQRFSSLTALWDHCSQEKQQSLDRWHPPNALKLEHPDGSLGLALGNDGAFQLNDWSFSQLCRLAEVSKDTVNRVSAATASRILAETMPAGSKPLQAFTRADTVRSIHGISYTRLYNAELLSMVMEFATDFTPPPVGVNGGTGLYCGEQDMFCFLIDPTGWAEIGDETFAPGFFLWNSEVGRRSVGIQTFWFQSVCQNHIVWDAVELAEFSRKHIGQVQDSLDAIRRIIEGLVGKRDQRRDGFVHVVEKAMETLLGAETDEALSVLNQYGINRQIAKEAVEMARQRGSLTVFTVVDALTRLSQRYSNAGDRTEADEKACRLLALAA